MKNEILCRVALFCLVVLGFVAYSPCLVSVYAQETEEETAPAAENSEGTTEQEQPEETGGEDLYAYEEPVVEETSYGWIIVKTLFVLSLFVLGFFLFFRYVSGRSSGQFVGQNMLQIKAVLPLGQNKSVHIVELGSKLLVLGVTDTQISLIKEVTEKDEIDTIKLQSSAAYPHEHRDFHGFLKNNLSSFFSLVGGKQNPPSSSGSGGATRADNTHTSGTSQAANSDTTQSRHDQNQSRRGYFDDDRLEYLKRQKSRLKRLGGLDDE